MNEIIHFPNESCVVLKAGVSVIVCERLFPLRSFTKCRPHGRAPKGPIWITNVFRFPIVHRFWSVEEFWDPLKPVDNDFVTPGATTGVRPPTDLSIGAQSLQQRSGSWVLIGSTMYPNTAQGVNVSFLFVARFLLAALFWFKSGLIKESPLLSCGQIILTPI